MAHAVVGREYCRTGEAVQLEMWKELGCCGAPDTVVREASTHAVLFTVEGHVAAFSSPTRILRDHTETALLSTVPKVWTFRRQIDVYRGERCGDREAFVFHVKEAGWSNKLHVYLPHNNVTQENPDYELQSNSFSRSMTIYKQAEVVAKANFHLSLTCCPWNPLYTITIQPGIDQAFIIMLVSIKDEINSRNSQSRGGG